MDLVRMMISKTGLVILFSVLTIYFLELKSSQSTVLYLTIIGTINAIHTVPVSHYRDSYSPYL